MDNKVKPTMNDEPTQKPTKKDTGKDLILTGLAGKFGICAYLLVMFALLAYLVYCLWPTSTTVDGKTVENAVVVFKHTFVPNDASQLLLVMVLGAIGSYIHAATSFIEML